MFALRSDADIASRIGHLDAMVIITDKVSPQVKDEAMKTAHMQCIQAFCATCEGAALCGRGRRHL